MRTVMSWIRGLLAPAQPPREPEYRVRCEVCGWTRFIADAEVAHAAADGHALRHRGVLVRERWVA